MFTKRNYYNFIWLKMTFRVDLKIVEYIIN